MSDLGYKENIWGSSQWKIEMRNKEFDCRKMIYIYISEKENQPKRISKEQLEFILIFHQNQAIQKHKYINIYAQQCCYILRWILI
jgi:hypothetical protein